ncbi:hypothetical protein Tco_0820898 [Tanacetum coccineum]|uniref:Reverse transcriptase domain-containing protein n=1 Tax=Tanacetum coccineum TaxID=301880 RepID=A0ABQ5AF00_9ASTR
MTDKYYPQGEIKKLEIELWNLKVKGNDVPAYTEPIKNKPDITNYCCNETEKVDKYISGLPDNIYGNVKSARPKTLDETIELANDLMDQKLCTYAERQSDNKRKLIISSRTNHGHQQQPLQEAESPPRSTIMGTCERSLMGDLAQVHQVPTSPQWPVHPEMPQVQQSRAFCSRLQEYQAFQRDYPKLKNKDGGNRNAQGWVYAVGKVREEGNCASGEPDANVVHGYVNLNNDLASILFDTGGR